MVSELVELLSVLEGLDPMFVIAFMLCLHLLVKKPSK